MRFFISLLCSVALSFGDANVSDIEEEIEAKLLYQSYSELPKKLFKGQFFPLTIKSLWTQEAYKSLDYDFSDARGLKLLSKNYTRKVQPPYFFDTFYFQVTKSNVKTPHITTTLTFNNNDEELKENLAGKKIETVRLNPENDFSNILAQDFKILEYKTSQYDNNQNIIVFSAEAKMANLENFSLKVATKEGIDEYEEDLPHSYFTYYAVVSKQLNELKFSYFNISTRRFQDVIIPIIVINDRVSTQTDLAPTQNTHANAKMILAGSVSVLGLILFFYRRKKLYLLIVVTPLFVIAKLAVPIKHVCVTEDSNLYLLPMKNGTVFEQTSYRFTTQELGTSQDFTKIRTHDNQIGWIKNEDLCDN